MTGQHQGPEDITVETPGFASSVKAGASMLALLLPVALWCGGGSCVASEPRPLPRFERIVIDDNFPGAYQVEVADVNGDGKPDVVALGGGTCAWYQNPTWKKRVVTDPNQTPGIISTATADLDGDGKAEIAVAYEFSMNQPARGKLLLAHPGKGLDDPWTLVPVADVPSIHRLRWMHTEILLGKNSVVIRPAKPEQASQQPDGTTHKRSSLVVAPLFGPSAKPPLFAEEPAQLGIFGVYRDQDQERLFNSSGGGIAGGNIGGGGIGGGGLGGQGQNSRPVDSRPRLSSTGLPPSGRLTPRIIGKAPVLHAIDISQQQIMKTNNFMPLILGASNHGITASYVAAIGGVELYHTQTLVPGMPGEAPKKGASEVHAGRLKDGRVFLATVEPWHGTDVAVYLGESILSPLGPRTVIDTTLKDGHALWVADVDGDGDDEVFAGYRGKGTSLIGYDYDGKTWNRTVIDSAIAAQDLRGGDIDGDGTPDFVGVGGSTHNVVWYRPMRD